MKKIYLKFDNTISNLAGNTYGVRVFENQVQDVLYDNDYEIIFPEQIQNIATSFIQGFFQKFVETIGIEGIEEKVNIVSSIDNLKQLVVECLV